MLSCVPLKINLLYVESAQGEMKITLQKVKLIDFIITFAVTLVKIPDVFKYNNEYGTNYQYTA